MSASPPEVPNDHKNYSETNSRREKKKCGRREGDLHPLFQAVTHLAWVAIRPEKEK